MSDVIDVREYIHIIKRNLWKIIITTVVCALTSLAITSYFIKPIYKANTTIIVGISIDDKGKSISSQSIDTTQLTATYGEIIKSRSVLGDIITRLNVPITYEKLYKNIDISIADGTQIISISVKNNNAKTAARIANEIPKVLSSNSKVLDMRPEVDILDSAIVPRKPVNSNVIINTFIAAIFGFLISVLVVIIKSYSDDRIKTPLDLSDCIEWRLLGVIPDESIKG